MSIVVSSPPPAIRKTWVDILPLVAAVIMSMQYSPGVQQTTATFDDACQDAIKLCQILETLNP